MIKKLIIFVFVISILGCSMVKVTYLLDKSVVLDNIKSIEKIRYTEGGSESVLLDDSQIESTYNYLSKLKIGEETNRACDDNTTIYRITMNDGTMVSIEIECDWAVIGQKRYLLKK